jgi:Kef-type K+ transport system membrane component KefB/predicted amino acid-binding ACT domain protein
MNTGRVLLDILVLLVAAKVAAELAERVRLPAVLGEIIAGVIIGPSALGLVKPSEVLAVLGELGVILLLVQVGMETDLRELGRVGKSSLSVAVVGVVIPFFGGWAGATALGHSGTAAVFVGAALTATSVGITARVFGDLRALATTEARIVLGAAVADDVLGLVILTVVSRIATEGSVSIAAVAGVVAVAVGFLVLSSLAGTLAAPKLFRTLHRLSRSNGTMLALALAFALGFAELASAAKLAPIVGAFVAGVALGRTHQSDRIGRELLPLTHVFVPVFFLQIGIEADLRAMLRPSVLGLAAVLGAIGIVGKVVAGWVAPRSTDRLLIGIGMIPRGEVGLIFASIGLRLGVFESDLYAAILLVVLATTVVTPPILRLRMESLRRKASVLTADEQPPPGGWIGVDDGEIVLRGRPPYEQTLPLALRVADLVTDATPSPGLLDWFATRTGQRLVFDDTTRRGLWRLFRDGDPRSWRFLEVTGVLADALPEMSEALERRRHDATQLDPAGNLRWPLVERLVQPDNDTRLATEYKRLDHPERVLLAALALDATDQGVDSSSIAMGLCARLGVSPEGDAAISDLVSKPELLRAAAARPTQLGQNHVLQLASHLGSEESVRASYVLGVVLGPMEQWEREALDELLDRLLPLVSGDVVEQRRQVARRLCQTRDAQERVDHAPRAYILAVDAASVARQAQLVDPLPRRGDVRLKIRPVDAVTSVVDVAGRDQKGFLAAVTRALATESLDVVDATIATWGDGGVVDSFIVRHSSAPSAEQVRAAVEQALRRPSKVSASAGTVLRFDDESSPWHTRCTVEALDRPGLLADLTASFASVGLSVHSARIRTDDGYAFDEFALSSRDGSKLTEADRAALVKALGAEIPDAQSAHAMETK